MLAKRACNGSHISSSVPFLALLLHSVCVPHDIQSEWDMICLIEASPNHYRPKRVILGNSTLIAGYYFWTSHVLERHFIAAYKNPTESPFTLFLLNLRVLLCSSYPALRLFCFMHHVWRLFLGSSLINIQSPTQSRVDATPQAPGLKGHFVERALQDHDL
jgi:hypothetical protein